MNYACISDKPFVTKKEFVVKKQMSDEQLKQLAPWSQAAKANCQN
jgi:hypothetical protein